jgi:methionyl-tRNA formyltransferase
VVVRILLVGEESAGVNVLRWLLTTEHVVVAVLTGGTTATPTALAGAAERAGVPVRPARLVREDRFAEWLETEDVDLLLNVHSLFLIPPEPLLAPSIGCFNLHPGPLPRYAGLNAPSWAIYCGEARHGTTVHWMTPGIDAGPIAYQTIFEITPEDTGLSVSTKCVRHGVPLVAKVVEAAASAPETIPKIEQDTRERSYFPPGPPDGGRVSWSAPARRIVDFVRAANYLPFSSPWGHPVTTTGDQQIELTTASMTGEPTEGAPPGTVGTARARGVLAAAADEWVLLQRLRVAGAAVWAAEALRTGMRLET